MRNIKSWYLSSVLQPILQPLHRLPCTLIFYFRGPCLRVARSFYLRLTIIGCLSLKSIAFTIVWLVYGALKPTLIEGTFFFLKKLGVWMAYSNRGNRGIVAGLGLHFVWVVLKLTTSLENYAMVLYYLLDRTCNLCFTHTTSGSSSDWEEVNSFYPKILFKNLTCL